MDIRVGEEKPCTYCNGSGIRIIRTFNGRGIVTKKEEMECYHCKGQGKWTWWNPPPWNSRR